MARFYEQLVAALAENRPFALALISGVKGSSPQRAGAKALFFPDGKIVGTLGGGCLEAEVHARAKKSLQTGQPATFEMVLDHDFGWDDGLICGGKVQGLILPGAQQVGEAFWTELAERKAEMVWGVTEDFRLARFAPSAASAPGPAPAGWRYHESISPACALWIAGAGHIAQAVAPLARQLDFAVTVFDDRPALANSQFFPGDVTLQADVWDKLLAMPLPQAPSFGLIVTRGHRHDALVLRSWIHKPFRFLGMIGSARKARTIFDHFIQENLATAAELERVACPVGVKIRCRSVMEIAVSIMAQFVDQRAEAIA